MSSIKIDTEIDNSKGSWTLDEDIEDFHNSYKGELHKTRFFIFEHRKNQHLYEPIYKCRTPDRKETVIIFNEYIYARLEQDDKTTCTNYVQKIGYTDMLRTFTNKLWGEPAVNRCIENVEQLIERDNQIMRHWVRTLLKLSKSLSYWIDARIPVILSNEVSKATSRHYTSIKRSMKEKKLFLDMIDQESDLLSKSRKAFVYLKECKKMIKLVTKQTNKWSTYKFNFNVNLLEDCPDQMKYTTAYYELYYKAWPNRIVSAEEDALDKLFEDLIEDFQLDVSVEDLNAMNQEYNRYLKWLSNLKTRLKKQPKISQEMIDNISPNSYINAARDYADKKKEKKENKKIK